MVAVDIWSIKNWLDKVFFEHEPDAWLVLDEQKQRVEARAQQDLRSFSFAEGTTKALDIKHVCWQGYYLRTYPTSSDGSE